MEQMLARPLTRAQQARRQRVIDAAIRSSAGEGWVTLET